MRAIVLGATGLIGRYLVTDLVRHGWDVVGATHPAEAGQGLLPVMLETPDPEFFRRAGQADVCVISAGMTSIDACKRDRERSEAINVAGTIGWIEAMRRRGIRPVYFSSDYVFSGNKGDYTEEDPCDPVTVYGEQKRAVELHLLRNGPSALIVRFCKIFSSDPRDKTLLSEWWQAAATGEEIRCAVDQFFRPTLVTDAAAAVQLLLARGASGVYHVCQPEKMNRVEMVHAFFRALGLEYGVVRGLPSSAFGFADHRGADTSLVARKFERETGFRFTSMEEAYRLFGQVTGEREACERTRGPGSE